MSDSALKSSPASFKLPESCLAGQARDEVILEAPHTGESWKPEPMPYNPFVGFQGKGCTILYTRNLRALKCLTVCNYNSFQLAEQEGELNPANGSMKTEHYCLELKLPWVGAHTGRQAPSWTLEHTGTARRTPFTRKISDLARVLPQSGADDAEIHSRLMRRIQ